MAGQTARGVVVRLTRKAALVRISSGGEVSGGAVRVALGGRLFDGSRRRTDAQAVAVGDEVEVEAADGGGRITAVLPRRNELKRATGPAERREMRTVAANLDRFLIVSAFREPPYRTGLLDRALALAYDAGIAPALVFNKADLADAADLGVLADDLAQYRRLELPIYPVSALTGEAVEPLREGLAGKRSVLFGHSGVGKTELLSALGVAERRRGGLDRRNRGRHTTTAAEILEVPGGGEIVDTPGVRALGLDGLTPERVLAAYPDLAGLAEGCRFAGCSHDREPDCAVKAAVEDGTVPEERYESLLLLREEAAEAADDDRVPEF